MNYFTKKFVAEIKRLRKLKSSWETLILKQIELDENSFDLTASDNFLNSPGVTQKLKN